MVGEGEHLGELWPEVAGAGIKVRLEHHGEFPVGVQPLDSGDDGADLLRMVGVVVDKDEVVAADLVVKPPFHAAEGLHLQLYLLVGEPRQQPDSAGSGGIGHVVHSRNTDGEAVRIPVFFCEGEAGGAGFH